MPSHYAALPHKMQGAKNWMVFDERTGDLIKKGMVRRDAETLRDLLNATSQPGAKALESEGTKDSSRRRS